MHPGAAELPDESARRCAHQAQTSRRQLAHSHTATQPHPPRYATGRPGEVLQLRNELCSRNAMRGARFAQADHMSRGCHTSDWNELVGFQIGRSLTCLLLLLLHTSRFNNVLPGRTSIVPPIHNTMWI